MTTVEPPSADRTMHRQRHCRAKTHKAPQCITRAIRAVATGVALIATGDSLCLAAGTDRARTGESREQDVSAVRNEVETALAKAANFFRHHVAVERGYVWRSGVDLTLREGEGRVPAERVWVQPPGTPSVGLAYLAAYEATDDEEYLEAARETAHCLVRGQLRSGGWDYFIEFDPSVRERFAYRSNAPGDDQRNVSTLDDNTTQAALRLLIRVDVVLDRQDAAIREAVDYALEQLLTIQYPNGAWPQRFSAPPNADDYPVVRASYPPSWSREYVARDYRGHYTLNDNVLANMVDVLLEAGQRYSRDKCRAAALQSGEFLMLAQMPDPQPAWAQQYDVEMHPAWARKFEPPAVTGGESFGALRTLLRLYRETGDERFLEPIPRALEYFRRSRLPDGRLARFYELETNRPLYFTREYELTYDDGDLPTHYGFKASDQTDAIAREYQRLLSVDSPGHDQSPAASRPELTDKLMERARAIVAALDAQGRWVEKGRLKYHDEQPADGLIIDSRTFVNNVQALARFLQATKRP